MYSRVSSTQRMFCIPLSGDLLQLRRNSCKSKAAVQERWFGLARCYRTPMFNVLYVSSFIQQSSMKYHAVKKNINGECDCFCRTNLKVEVRWAGSSVALRHTRTSIRPSRLSSSTLFSASARPLTRITKQTPILLCQHINTRPISLWRAAECSHELYAICTPFTTESLGRAEHHRSARAGANFTLSG